MLINVRCRRWRRNFTMKISLSTHVLRTFALAIFCLSVPATALAGPIKNPWQSLAPVLFNDEETFLAPNEFDAMDALQLAAVPTGQRIKWSAPANCVPGSLKGVLKKVAARFGPITVSSTARSRAKNRRVGGRSKSYHLGCRAVDFRVHGSTRGLGAFLASQKAVGGLKRYRSGFYHIDNGPRRSW
jgi:uncharacterized protein YcbK (DUF882 family)